MAAAYPYYHQSYEHYQGAPPPPHAPPGPGYPPASQAPPNGYHATSPHDQQPPRPHTAAPFASHQYGPPPPQAGYYGHQPAAPAPGAPPTPVGNNPAYPPPGQYGRPPPSQPEGGPIPTAEQIESVLRWMRTTGAPGGGGPPPPPAPPAQAPGPPPPGEATAPPRTSPPSNSMPPPPAPQPPPPPPPSDPYAYPRQHNGSHPSPRTPAPLQMPGSYDYNMPPAAAPGPPPPSKTPVSSRHRPESRRKASEYSETSAGYGSGTSSAATWKESMTSASISNNAAFEQWGKLVENNIPGKEPRPTPKLKTLFREVANYMIRELEPKNSIVVTIPKLLLFYDRFALTDDPLNWRIFITNRKPRTLSQFFAALNVEHYLVPDSHSSIPSIPALTPAGFETWMFTQLMAHPDIEARRIQRILHEWHISDPVTRTRFPDHVARECFPPYPDDVIRNGLYDTREEHQKDVASYPTSEALEFEEDEDDDEEHERLALPEAAPGQKPPPGGEEPFIPPNLTRRRTSRPYNLTNIPADINPANFLTQEEKTSSPTLERTRLPYGGKLPQGFAREELNPRPNLGEEPRPHGAHSTGHASQPPMPRSRSMKAPGRSARDPSKAPSQSSGNRRPRRKSVHRNDTSWSGDSGGHGDPELAAEESFHRKLENLETRGRAPPDDRYYVGDGLYEDEMHHTPVSVAPPAHHRSHGHAHSARRAQSRGPPRHDKDIRDYGYQEDYLHGSAPGGGGMPPGLGGGGGGAGSGSGRTSKRRSTGYPPHGARMYAN